MSVTPAFWSGRRVFMTGHTGFKGSWATRWLTAMGAEVTGYALAPDRSGLPAGHGTLFDELDLAGRVTHHIADVRDRETLRRALREAEPEVVIHMAAQPLVRLSYREPVETYATNVMGTVHLLDACRDLPGLRAVVVVSSDKCYENREQIWGYRETDPMGGHDPYSNSKGCTELVTAAYRSSFFHPDAHDRHGVAVCSGRAGNVIGGGDWSSDRLVPDAMRAYVAGETLSIRNPSAVRPWQHVLEPVSGYLRLAEFAFAEPKKAACGWNFGPGDDMNLTVGEVIGLMAEKLGSGFSWRHDGDPHQLHEANLLKLDCTQARVRLGWSPRLSADEMVTAVAEWYRAGSAADRVRAVDDQIALFAAGRP